MTNNAYSHIEQLPYILQILAQRCVDQLIAATDDPATHNADLVGKLQRNLSGILRNLTLVERLTKSPEGAKASKQKTPPAIPQPTAEPTPPIQIPEPTPSPEPEQPAEPQPVQQPPTSTLPPAAPLKPQPKPKPSAAPPRRRAKYPSPPKTSKHRRPQTKGAFGISKFRRQHKKP